MTVMYSQLLTLAWLLLGALLASVYWMRRFERTVDRLAELVANALLRHWRRDE